MEDASLAEERKKKRKRFKIALISFVVITAVLAIINVAFLYLLSLILMIVGVVSMMNTGAQMARWKYFTLPVQYGGFHEHEMVERREKERIADMGMLVAIIGFMLFILAIYVTSLGWNGFF